MAALPRPRAKSCSTVFAKSGRTSGLFCFVKVAQVIDGKKATGIACTTYDRTAYIIAVDLDEKRLCASVSAEQ
jgi:hypothetical protein